MLCYLENKDTVTHEFLPTADISIIFLTYTDVEEQKYLQTWLTTDISTENPKNDPLCCMDAPEGTLLLTERSDWARDK